MEDSMTIGKRLLELRGSIPRKTICKAVNITYTALSNYENGLRIPRDEVKVALANFFGKTVEEIFFK